MAFDIAEDFIVSQLQDYLGHVRIMMIDSDMLQEPMKHGKLFYISENKIE